MFEDDGLLTPCYSDMQGTEGVNHFFPLALGTVADPGFPIGWVLFSKTCAKMEELDPMGGCTSSAP